MFAGPLSTDVALDGEHVGRVVELFAGIFTDAFEGAAALAVAVVRLVMDQRAWKLRWQRCALGLQPHFGFDRRGLQRFKLSFNGGDVNVDQVVKQAGLIRTYLLAALGKLDAFELRDFVGQLLIDRLVMGDLLAHRLDALDQLRRQGTQLFRV